MINLDKLKVGEEISIDDMLDMVRGKIYITKHALERMEQRGDLVVRDERGVNWRELFKNIRNAISNSLISYVNIDEFGVKSINCCIDEYNYFVFGLSNSGQWTMITYKEPSHNKINVFEKQKMAINGVVYYNHDK